MQCGSVKSRRGEQQVLVAMKTLVVFLVAVLITVESIDNDESGKYVPDDEGRYYPDNSGQYVPDFSGRYAHDPSGAYKNDGTGNANGFLTGRSQNLFDTTLTKKPAPIPTPRALPLSSTTTQRAPEGHWKIIRQVIDTGLDAYHWAYETENNIVAEETGKLENQGTDAEAIRAKGFFKYTGPDNVVYSIGYTADENGFVAEGKHIPTEPPLPEAIVKAIEDLRKAAALLEEKA